MRLTAAHAEPIGELFRLAAADAGHAMVLEKAVSGKLYGIGVGPGDPELMTLKAVRILAEVPVIAYPAPNSGESSARAIAEKFIPAGRIEIAVRVPMRVGPVPLEAYERAAEEIATHLEAGRDVAVLCEGDPFFYGSFMYLHDALADRFPTTIVPGVSSLTACAAASGRPLVRRDDVLTIVPATLDDAAIEERLSAIACRGDHEGRPASGAPESAARATRAARVGDLRLARDARKRTRRPARRSCR